MTDKKQVFDSIADFVGEMLPGNPVKAKRKRKAALDKAHKKAPKPKKR